MKVLINAFGITDSGGIDVLEKLILELINSSKKNHFIFILSDNKETRTVSHNFRKFSNLTFKNVRYRFNLYRFFYENFFFRKIIKKNDIDLVYNFSGSRQYLISSPQLLKIHNLLFYSQELNKYYFSKNLYIKWVKEVFLKGIFFRLMLRTAKNVEVQSSHVKTCISDFLNIDNKKFYIKSDINIDDDSFNTIGNIYSFKKIRFLYIVGPHFQYAHKNFRDFVNAMLYFKETNINFEINITLTEEECNNSNLWDNSLNEYTNFHGYISNKDKLRELYSDDTILISTSIIETLGLHVVDGIKNGIITISPNEDYANVVYGPESYKYKLYSNESLVNVVKDVINNKSSLNEKIILQQEYLKFNEKKKYKNIIEVFNEVLDV